MSSQRQVYASTRGYDAGKDQRGITGIDWIPFSRHKHFINDVCTYGSSENIYACLQLFMVAIRTNLFTTPSLRVGTMLVRISEVWWEWTEFFSHVTNVWLMMYAHMEASKIFTRIYSIHGSHTHQSARNAKSTRGYVRACTSTRWPEACTSFSRGSTENKSRCSLF